MWDGFCHNLDPKNRGLSLMKRAVSKMKVYATPFGLLLLLRNFQNGCKSSCSNWRAGLDPIVALGQFSEFGTLFFVVHRTVEGNHSSFPAAFCSSLAAGSFGRSEVLVQLNHLWAGDLHDTGRPPQEQTLARLPDVLSCDEVGKQEAEYLPIVANERDHRFGRAFPCIRAPQLAQGRINYV
jgi:hypothetical protein